METMSRIEIEDDDKDLKELKQRPSFFVALLAALPCGGTCSKEFLDFLKNPLKVYSLFLLCIAIFYAIMCDGMTAWEDFIGYNSCVLEAYGLISVFRKIQRHRSVLGISGNSLIMFLVSYGLRQCEALVMSSRYRLTKRAVVLECLQFASIPLVISLVWAVFKTYRESYQESLDKLKVKYLIPGCVALALVLTPRFKQGEMYSYCWTISFYVDVLALLPQVVMMHYTPGKKIALPIADFVAATSVSRIVDLWFWYLRFDLGPQGWWGNFNYSGWIIVTFHIISLFLVADFMYYYMRARCAALQGEDKHAMLDEARGVVTI
jgi:hypothetical protein